MTQRTVSQSETAWRTDEPPFDDRPIYQFVLLEGLRHHNGYAWSRKWAGTATIDAAPDSRLGYRKSDIDRIERDGDMELGSARLLGWLPATYPSFAEVAGASS